MDKESGCGPTRTSKINSVGTAVIVGGGGWKREEMCGWRWEVKGL